MADPPEKHIIGSCYKKGTERASGGPWLKLPINTYTMAPDSKDLIELGTFTLMPSLMSMPAHLGSKKLETIKAVVTSFLPLTNIAVAFEADRQNIKTNAKASESWDCRIPIVELHAALLKHGLELDVDAALVVVLGHAGPACCMILHQFHVSVGVFRAVEGGQRRRAA